VIEVFVIFLVLVAMGMPVAFAIGISGFVFYLREDFLSLTIPPQVTLTQTQNFAILAIPCSSSQGTASTKPG
jgi:TRAP-type mannitol/chloroaromatic compound transport system permease large subunit